jgi:GNAT superfamily N-acetyltransferase
VGLVIRPAETDADLEAWRRVRLVVLPNERASSVDDMREMASDETLYLLAELGGSVAGSGLSGRSSFDYAGLHPQVLPSLRRRGVGTALLRALAQHAMAKGFTEAGSLVGDAASLAFAERFGFGEVDRQVEQLRTIGEEHAPTFPDGIRVVTVAERPELWAKAYDAFAATAIGDMATYRPIVVTREQWERDWISWPEATFLALDGEEPVGCAGLEYDADRPHRAEHAFTAVARDWRHRGLATSLKRLTLHFAATHGVREVYTWTQPGNAIRGLNERLGYVYRSESIAVRGPLPLPR